jgi:Domain of unknown function (DUF4112)
MLDNLLLWLTVAFVIVAVLSAAGFFVARWLFIRTAERVSTSLEQRVGGAAAQTLSRLAAYAKATGVDLDEADRRFGLYIDRFARLMDSAITLPVLGPVGLDAAISVVPVLGDVVGGVLSLTLVARSLRYGPPATLVSKMLANVLTDVIIGAIPVFGVLGDIWFRANDRNAALMRAYLQERPSSSSSVGSAVPQPRTQ